MERFVKLAWLEGNDHASCSVQQGRSRATPIRTFSPSPSVCAAADGSFATEEPRFGPQADLPGAGRFRQYAAEIYTAVRGRRGRGPQGTPLPSAAERVDGLRRRFGGAVPGPSSGHNRGGGSPHRGADRHQTESHAGGCVPEESGLAATESGLPSGQGRSSRAGGVQKK